MLKNRMWYCYWDALDTELRQCRDEGKEIPSELEEEVRELEKVTRGPFTEEEYDRVMALIDRLEALPEPEVPVWQEPSDREGIRALSQPRRVAIPYDEAAIENKVHGAWIGRVTGCLIGKPVEGRNREYIRKLAEADGNWPITRYLHGNVPHPESDPFFEQPAIKNGWFLERINGFSPADDDTNYTTLYLTVLETYGRDFTSIDVAEAWLGNFPALCLCTAEQAAFRNFVSHVLPPRSGSYRNPYREWIGAQIRGDFFGYINPGDPLTAADYAFRDACCTHTKNGIYGEMFAAAMIAEAAVSSDMHHIVETGLSVIPSTSRLWRDVKKILALYDAGISYEDTVEAIHQQYPMNTLHNSVHTNPNAMIVATALLYGEGDYARTLGMSIMPGMDTDCNGATVGSVIGMVTGADRIPAHFTDPICDTLCTDIVGNARVSISDMAKRTMKFIPAK